MRDKIVKTFKMGSIPGNQKVALEMLENIKSSVFLNHLEFKDLKIVPELYRNG